MTLPDPFFPVAVLFCQVLLVQKNDTVSGPIIINKPVLLLSGAFSITNA